jgi:hypothetical protein
MSEAGGGIRERAEKFLGNIKGITDVKARDKVDEIAGGGKLVTCEIKRNGDNTWGWYFEKDEIKEALFTGEEIAKFIANVVSPKSFVNVISSTPPVELIKLTVVSSLTLLFSIAVILVVVIRPDNPSLQVLTGLLGITIGYFVGKGDKPS